MYKYYWDRYAERLSLKIVSQGQVLICPQLEPHSRVFCVP